MSQPSWLGYTLGGRYKIEEPLGQGGMSAVYKATDPNLRRIVAVKMIHAHLSSEPGFVRRFEEEAAAVAQLRHPNIIQVFDFNHEGETYYMVLEFIPGETLQSRLKRMSQAGRQFELTDVLEIIASVCDAVDYAHKKGLVHRDIKPANVMLNVQGQAILMDFGIAKIAGGQTHTATGAVVGTAMYMSPEQIRADALDGRSDIYSLGVMLFEMLNGRPPFQADSAMTLMMMHLHDPVPNLGQLRPGIPSDLVAVVNKALGKLPEERYQSAVEMAAALRKVQARLKAGAPTAEASQQPMNEPTFIAPPSRTYQAPPVSQPGTPPSQPQPAVRQSSPQAYPPSQPVSGTGPKPAVTGTGPRPAVGGSGPKPAVYPDSTYSQPRPLQPGKKGLPMPLLIGGGAVLLLLVCAVVGGMYLWNQFGPQANTPTRAPTNTLPLQAALPTETTGPLPTNTSAALPTDTAAAPAPTQGSPLLVTSFNDVKKATIQIESQGTFIDPEFGAQVNAAGRGSGFIIDPSGLAVTNNHVVSGAALLKVYVGGDQNTVYNARILGVSECSDLAVIQITGSDFPFLGWFDGDTAVGQEVYAAGFPLGDPEYTMTRGIVSKENTSGDTNWASVDGVVEHDATINPGNSGGPLVAPDGRVVGVNFAGSGATGQYFAIGRQAASGVVDILKTGADYQSIGINPRAVSTEDGSIKGVWVAAVESGSPADRAGVKAGDMITALEGVLLAQDGTLSSYCDILQTRSATDTMSINVLRWATGEELEGQLNGRELQAAAPPTTPYVRINKITLDNNRYVVEYETFGYTEQLPGQHVHFFFNTVAPEQAGRPGLGPWILYGGPRPFQDYTVGDRPANATQMCALVANSDHSVIQGSGNCKALP
jgi:serine/threonine protein kinase/S1-C subfamily serine protease